MQGTPHSFLNGRVVNGAQPIAKWKKLIDEELLKAEARVKAGTAADKVYAETIKGGKEVALAKLTIPADAGWRGGANAKVVIHLFADFQCPFCRRLARPVPNQQDSATLEKLQKKYGDKIKIVWRDFPLAFHNRARAAANFAREAKKQKGMAVFWKVHDDLFDMPTEGLGDAKLEEIAKTSRRTRLSSGTTTPHRTSRRRTALATEAVNRNRNASAQRPKPHSVPELCRPKSMGLAGVRDGKGRPTKCVDLRRASSHDALLPRERRQIQPCACMRNRITRDVSRH